MDRIKSIGELVSESRLARVASPPNRPDAAQAELFTADTTWFPILRALLRTGTMARLGPFGIAAYLALKARAGLGNGRAVVSIRMVAQDTGMSDRAAREAVRRLEVEGLITTEASHGRRNAYQIVERLEIVDDGGQPVGVVEWPFSATTWRDHLKKIVAAAVSELAAGRPQTTINIGTLNILVMPEKQMRTSTIHPQDPVDESTTSAGGAEVDRST